MGNNLSNNTRFSQSHTIHNAMSHEFVDFILNGTHQYVAKHGWTKDRHLEYAATTDIDTEWIPDLNDALRPVFETFYSFYTEHYGIASDLLSIHETFVVKYEYKAGAQTHLNSHRDGCEYSFVLALNDPSEYGGGGTRFDVNPHEIVRLDKGVMVIFPGRLDHEGIAITHGTRLILAGFLTIIPNSNGDGCAESMAKVKIVITNHLDVEVELFFFDESIGFLPPGEWDDIEAYDYHRFSCNDDLCDFIVDSRQKYYEIWP